MEFLIFYIFFLGFYFLLTSLRKICSKKVTLLIKFWLNGTPSLLQTRLYIDFASNELSEVKTRRNIKWKNIEITLEENCSSFGLLRIGIQNNTQHERSGSNRTAIYCYAVCTATVAVTCGCVCVWNGRRMKASSNTKQMYTNTMTRGPSRCLKCYPCRHTCRSTTATTAAKKKKKKKQRWRLYGLFYLKPIFTGCRTPYGRLSGEWIEIRMSRNGPVFVRVLRVAYGKQAARPRGFDRESASRADRERICWLNGSCGRPTFILPQARQQICETRINLGDVCTAHTHTPIHCAMWCDVLATVRLFNNDTHTRTQYKYACLYAISLNSMCVLMFNRFSSDSVWMDGRKLRNIALNMLIMFLHI